MYATELRERRVAIYARVSTEHEAQLSALENQIDWYKPILDGKPNWKLTYTYIDEGITGTSAEKRPEFMKMIKDANNSKFDLIITREVSRFARNTVDTLQYTRALKSKGVEVFFINDNIRTFDGDGELRLTIMATLAQDESRKTSIRVKSGQQTSMKNGVLYGNGNILGYDRVGKELIINPEQAKIVRLIYDLYLQHYGLQQIRNELERRGIKTAMGKEHWSCTTISGILKNSFYCGLIKYHKQYVPDYLTQKKIKNGGEKEYITVKGTHETIVTEEEYCKVQSILESKQIYLNTDKNTILSHGKKERSTVWGKLLLCECGRSFSLKKWHKNGVEFQRAYQCYMQSNSGSYASRIRKGLSVDGYCKSPMIPEWKLKLMAKHIFQNFLLNKDVILEKAKEMLAQHINDKKQTEDNSEIAAIKKEELEKLRKKLDNLIDMRAEGEITREIFQNKSAELNEKINKITADLLMLTEHKDEPENKDYNTLLASFYEELEKYLIFDNDDIKDSVIEAFVQKIIVRDNSFDWFIRVGDKNENIASCILNGKRKENSSIYTDIKPEKVPTIVTCNTGRS